MTSYFSIFVLMVGFTMGINILVGAFITSPDFVDLDKSALLSLQLGSNSSIPADLKPSFAPDTDCFEEGTTLIGKLCNPTVQTLETTSTENGTVTSSGIAESGGLKTSSIQDQVGGDVTDFSQTSVFSLNNAIAVLSGDFIFKAISALFVEDIANIPEEFIIGWKVIIGLMYVGLIVSLLFGRSLSTAS